MLKAGMFRHPAPKSGMKFFNKGKTHLMSHRKALLCNGNQQRMDVLVETGAEACLVRQGLLEANIM